MVELDIEQMCALMSSKQDQDMEQCKQWLQETDNADLLKMWLFIQQEFENGDPIERGPMLEVMSRFAQLGFTEAMLSEYRTELDDG